MKDFKLSNRELCLCILLVFFGFIGVFSLYQLKNNNSMEQSIDNFNSGIASRYVNIVNEEETAILDFLLNNIGNEFVVVPAMDYVFNECFPRFSDEGKASLYYFYYDNYRRFQVLYQELIDVTEYTYYLNSFLTTFDEEVDINNYEIYSQIELTSLRTLIHELRQSHFKLYQNTDYFEVYYDYEWFYEEYKSILPEEFVSFINLDSLSMSPLVSPNREVINIVAVEDLVKASKDYMDNFADKNSGLRYGALQLFRSSLQFFAGGDVDSVYLYSDDEKYIIDSEAYKHYDEFIEKYPDNTLSILLTEIMNIMKEKEGKGELFVDDISNAIDNYLIEYGYATESEIEEFKEQEGTNNVSFEGNEFLEESLTTKEELEQMNLD